MGSALERWRRYAELRGPMLTVASKRVPLASLAQQARALSLWDGKQVVPGNEMQYACVLDLGVLDPVGEHGRGIDRHAKAEPAVPDSDAARLLVALQAARFRLFRLLGPHPDGGVAAETFPEATPLRFFDNYLGNAPPGSLLGARLAWPDPDVGMTCGTAIAVDSWVLDWLLRASPPDRGPVIPRAVAADDHIAVARLLDDPAAVARLVALQAASGFAAQVYRASIDLGMLGPVPGRTPANA